jgi:hypothetical protein
MRTILLLLVALGMLAVPVFANGTVNDTVNETDANDTDVNETDDLDVTTDDNETEDLNLTVDGNDTVDLNVTENDTEDLNLTADTETFVSAVTEDVDESEVGALPGDFWYGFQRFFENVDKFLTFDKSEKAKKHANYGKLRSIEAHLMTKKAQQLAAEGKTSDEEATLEEVRQLLADQAYETGEAQGNLETAVDEGTADEEDVDEVETELRNSIRVLQRVYEQAPESAKPGLARALNNSIENQEKHEQKMAEKGLIKASKKGGKGDGTDLDDGTEADDEEKLKVEVEGNVELDDDANSTLDDLVASLEGVEGSVKLELEVKKEDGVVNVTSEVEGNLTAEQESLWETLKDQAVALVEASEEDDANLEISIEHELEAETEDDEGLDATESAGKGKGRGKGKNKGNETEVEDEDEEEEDEEEDED